MGDAWIEQSYVGLRRVSPITIAGFYDDVAASGPVAILGNASVQETLSKFLTGTALGDVAMKTLGMASAASMASRALSQGKPASPGGGNGELGR